MGSAAGTTTRTPAGNNSDLKRWLHSLMLLVTPRLPLAGQIAHFA
jgi:hypothetical protein